MSFNSILEFVEGPTGLNWTLLPVQRFILKLHYGIELDTHNAQIHIFDHFQERLRYSLSEADYLDYLFGEGRCSVSDQSSLPRPGLVLAAGRRTEKSTLAHMIASYTVIQMLQMGNPHEVFGFNTVSNHLLVACYIGLNWDLGRDFLSGVRFGVERCPDLQEATVPAQNVKEIRFMTPEGRRRNLTHGNLAIRAFDPRPRIHASARGALIIDELAYMPNEVNVFNANIPTVAPPGRYVLMSTFKLASGPFYNQFQRARENHPDSPLALQIPTWEMQPEEANLGSLLRQRFKESPRQFTTEYGAELPCE
jgi:hypothetical protein